MENINNDKKLAKLLESINEEYSIGELKGSYVSKDGELKIYFNINSFIFTLVMIKSKYDEVYEHIAKGRERLARNNIIDFIIKCLEGIDMKYMFDNYYDPENETHHPFELVDYLRVLDHYIKDLLKDLKSDRN